LDRVNLTRIFDEEHLSRGAESILRMINDRISERSNNPHYKTFNYHPIFRAPMNANNLWASEIALMSSWTIQFADQLNIFLNGGFIDKEAGEYRKYKDKVELAALRLFSDQYTEVLGYINDTLKQKEELRQMGVIMLGSVSETEVGCLYDQMSKNEATVYKTFTELVSRERFVDFSLKFINEVKELLKSENTEQMITSWFNAIKAKLITVDKDALQSETYLLFLRARTLLLGIDIEQVFENLKKVDRTIQKGWWMTLTGKWPAMVDFINSFFTHTFMERAFWERLDALYHEQVEMTKKYYEGRQKSLETNMSDEVIPLFKSLLEFMVQMRKGEKTFVDEYIAEFEKIDLDDIIRTNLAKITSTLSRYYLSCFTSLYGKPDFDLVATMAEENSMMMDLKKLVFANWPATEIVPKGFDSFANKLIDLILLMWSSSFGTCTDPMYG